MYTSVRRPWGFGNGPPLVRTVSTKISIPMLFATALIGAACSRAFASHLSVAIRSRKLRWRPAVGERCRISIVSSHEIERGCTWLTRGLGTGWAMAGAGCATMGGAGGCCSTAQPPSVRNRSPNFGTLRKKISIEMSPPRSASSTLLVSAGNPI
jgi:hypothetical protein